jgi:hypothetical protein
MSRPTRIEPLRLNDGRVITPNPPTGGSWVVAADGALVPRDHATANRAGLDWIDTSAAPAVAPAAPTATASSPAVAVAPTK